MLLKPNILKLNTLKIMKRLNQNRLDGYLNQRDFGKKVKIEGDGKESGKS